MFRFFKFASMPHFFLSYRRTDPPVEDAADVQPPAKRVKLEHTTEQEISKLPNATFDLQW